MAQYEEYKKNRETYLQEQRQKGLSIGEQIGAEADLTAKELQRRFGEREKVGTFRDRAKYFFEDVQVMEAKAARYRNLVAQGNDLEQYAATYSYHSAGKRKRSANKAADAFERAAELEKKYADDRSKDSLPRFTHKEEVMRMRLIAMERVAEVKSRSKENEMYRKQKAKLSCLTALREQAKLLLNIERKEEIKEALKEELTRIEGELSDARKEMEKLAPSVEKQWTQALGGTEQVKETCKALKQDHPDATEEDAEALMRVKKLAGAAHSFPMRVVLRDARGLPINLSEQKKEEHNRKWQRALSTGNVEEQHQVLAESFRYFETLEIPSPRQIKERGILYFLRNRPAEFFEIIQLGRTYGNLDQNDAFLKTYEVSHPAFMPKLQAAVMLGKLSDTLLLHEHMVTKTEGEAEDSYEMKEKSRSAIVEESKNRLEEDYASFQNAWDAAYKQGPVRGEVLEYLDEKQQQAINLYAEKYPDAYDREKRKEMEAPLESELGKELLKRRTVDDLSVLAKQAYQEVIGGDAVPASKMMQRAEGAVEKKKLQMALKNRMEIFLNKRQIRIGRALTQDFFVHVNDQWRDRQEKQNLVREQRLNPRYLKFAEDWCASSVPYSLLKDVDPENEPSVIPKKIEETGKYIMELNLSAFEYKSDAEFVSKLQDNYQWLKMAESMKEVVEMEKEGNRLSSTRELALSALEGRLMVLMEMKEDYDSRIAMINSPYYALLAQTDLETLSDEELERKQREAEQTNPGLFTFLKHYRHLNRRKEGFGKGVSAVRREEILSSDGKQAVAEKQEAALGRLREGGYLPREEESKKDYKERLERMLTEKAEEMVPEINGDYVKKTEPPLGNRFANMDPPDMLKLETWLEKQFSNEGALKEKGLTDEEITELKKIRKKSLEARRGLEIRRCIIKEICGDWDPNTLENPKMNDKLNVETYRTLHDVYDTFVAISVKFGLPKELEDQYLETEQWYESSMLEMTEIFARHKILYTENADQVLEKGKNKAKAQAEQEQADGKDQMIQIGGKEYRMAADENVRAQLNGLSIKEENRPLVEEKLNRIQELYYYAMGCDIVYHEGKGGVYIAEYRTLRSAYNREINELIAEIRQLGNAANSNGSSYQ